MNRIIPGSLNDLLRHRKNEWLALLAGLAGLTLLSGCASVRVKDTRRTFDTVVIDAGHGGFDSGTSSRRTGPEKNAALDVALRVEERLRAAGFRTVLTRQDDVFVPLETRAQISNSQQNALFVSIHFNDAPARRIHGVETYYHSGYGAEVADRIQKHLVSLPQASDRGVKHANFRVLRLARYPAVLVECGFFSNAREAALCAKAGYRAQLAEKIADALVEQRYGPNREQAARVAAVR